MTAGPRQLYARTLNTGMQLSLALIYQSPFGADVGQERIRKSQIADVNRLCKLPVAIFSIVIAAQATVFIGVACHAHGSAQPTLRAQPEYFAGECMSRSFAVCGSLGLDARPTALFLGFCQFAGLCGAIWRGGACVFGDVCRFKIALEAGLIIACTAVTAFTVLFVGVVRSGLDGKDGWARGGLNRFGGLFAGIAHVILLGVGYDGVSIDDDGGNGNRSESDDSR